MLRFELPPLGGTNSVIKELVLGLIANLILAVPTFIALDRVFHLGTRQRSRRAEAMRGMRRRRWKKMV
jgi:hypothetical protein